LIFTLKGRAADADGAFPGIFQLLFAGFQQVGNMHGLSRRTDGGNRLHRIYFQAGHQDRRSSQRVTYQQLRGIVFPGHVLRCGHQVLYIGAEGGVGKFALALTEASKVESKHRDAFLGEGQADVFDGLQVFAAGEAMGKDGAGPGLLVQGQVHTSCQQLPFGIGKFDAGRFHEGDYWMVFSKVSREQEERKELS
jgi:hypothetical protein